MTERMDDERIKEALRGCKQKREDNTHWDEQDRGNLSSPLNVLETEHALHDLQDARAETEQLREVHNIMHRIIGIAVVYKCIIKGAIARCGSWSCVGCRARNFTDEAQAVLKAEEEEK